MAPSTIPYALKNPAIHTDLGTFPSDLWNFYIAFFCRKYHILLNYLQIINLNALEFFGYTLILRRSAWKCRGNIFWKWNQKSRYKTSQLFFHSSRFFCFVFCCC